MQKRRTWVNDAAKYAFIFVILVTAVPFAAYVHENASHWEVPAAVASLVLGVLSLLWYWRTKRYGWVVAILALEFLTFAFISVLILGGEALALALLFGVSIAYIVAIIVNGSRVTRRVESSMRAFGEGINGDPLFRRQAHFRDDGQRIVVYPRQRRLIIGVVSQAAILAGIVVAFALWRSVDTILLWILLAPFACLLLLIFPAWLYRLVAHKPSLVAGPDGILDDATLTWSGVGLLRWDEVLSVTPTTRSSGRMTYHYLDIMVTDLPAIRRRLPLLKRFGLRNTNSGMSQLLIGQSMLETPVADLAEQIDRYVKTHAPAGWFGDEARDSAPRHDGGEA